VAEGVAEAHVAVAVELGRERNDDLGAGIDRALEEAGIDRQLAYVTNAVKHFKWEPRGKRRLHQKPSIRDVAACKPWLQAELQALEPEILVLFGSTAAQTVFGPSARVLRDRGQIRPSELCDKTVITVHPSSLLRAPDEASRERNYAEFVADLKKVARALK
jgi:DNA polymerase